MSTIEIRVPDIGDFKDVPIIEVHVAAGRHRSTVDDPLITLESDKATLEVPAPAGRNRRRDQGQGRRPGLEGDLDRRHGGRGRAGHAAEGAHHRSRRALAGRRPAGYGSPSGVYESIEVKVPDIGDFKDVPIIEVHVQPGATISAEDPLITPGVRQGYHGDPGAARRNR